MISLRLKRHETFSIREGWLEKGLNIIKENPECFKKDEGPKYFGLGSNMCKSLKYWLVATKLAEFSTKAQLSKIGFLLSKYDPFLENKFSWFLIHSILVMNEEDAPVINQIFNSNYSRFDKELITHHLTDYFTYKQYEIGAESSLDSDVNIALKSYCVTDVSNPEDNLGCPFSKLGLMKMEDRKFYVKQQPTYKSLDKFNVYYVMIQCMKDKDDFNLEDLINERNNPLKVFNISKSMLFLYLDDLKNLGIINVIKTAGLNTIHIEKRLDIEDIFVEFFKEN